jgi:general secretion pathway protein C
MKHLPFVSSSTLLIAACASAGFWGLPWFRSAATPAVATQQARPAPPDIAAAAGLFGGAPAGPAATAYQLKGVIEDGPDGVAILVADGKPAQAVGVGREVAPGVKVTEIHQRYVLLDEGGAIKRLELPDGGIAGLELVAATSAIQPAAPPVKAVTVAKSGGAMPLPVAPPTTGLPQQQVVEKQRADYMDHVRQMQEHRPSGIGPAAFGSPPTT